MEYIIQLRLNGVDRLEAKAVARGLAKQFGVKIELFYEDHGEQVHVATIERKP